MLPNQDAETGGAVLGSLLQAVVEALGVGVVVFDQDGRMAYATAKAQKLLGSFAGLAPGEQLLRELLERGGRRVPLQLGPGNLGEAVVLPGAETPTLAERERLAILETLQATQWRLAEAARYLGISRTTLWRRLKAYGLRRDGR